MVLLRSVAWRHMYRNVYRLIMRTDPNRGILSTLPLCANQMLRKASVARVDRRLRRYYLIVRLLPNVFALACRSLGSI